MSILATRSDLERFRSAIEDRIGLQFYDSRLTFLGEVLQRRLDALGQSSASGYIWNLEQGTSADEPSALARELTVGETYFFRNIEQFHVLADVVLPERAKVRGAGGALRFLSAGCASGEEAYSIAIVARETFGDRSREIVVRAVDLNPTFLEKAARAWYSPWALRDTSAEIQRKWFRPKGREFVLDEEMRAAVKIEAANLASDDGGLWQPGSYDAIFCRNVLMYFSPSQMRAVIARIARSLAPGGFLFLGHAETLRGISNQFHLRHSHGTFYYELKDRADTCAETPSFFPARVPLATIAPASSTAWFDAIRRASERVAKLVPDRTIADREISPAAARWDPAPALDLLRKERFAEALAHVRTRPVTEASDPDVLLLEAALLAHGGQLVAAEDACLRLLVLDELNAGAHYVLALCREQSGHLQRAIEHNRVATYLNPAFAIPRLHLGLLAGRIGDRAGARRELKQALDLLKREDPSTLLLFGGGFSREALMAVCEAALKENGERP